MSDAAVEYWPEDPTQHADDVAYAMRDFYEANRPLRWWEKRNPPGTWGCIADELMLGLRNIVLGAERDERLDYERRILALELALKDAMRVAEEARTLAAIMRRNCENIDHAICVASNNRYHQDDGGGFKIEGFMPSVIAVEKAIAELTGIDGDDDWYWKQRRGGSEPS
jgi:hypothetical protein